MKEMKFIKEHHCKSIDSAEHLSITLYRQDEKEHWYYCVHTEGKIITNEIRICPYCGAILDEQIPEIMMPKPLLDALPVIQELFGDNARFIPSVDVEVHVHRDLEMRVSSFTCYGCAGATNHFKEGGGRCEFAFDLYNTDGDCLMDK